MSVDTLKRFSVIGNMSMNMNKDQLGFLIVGLFEFLLLHIFMDSKRVHRFFSGFSYLIPSLFTASSDSTDHPAAMKKGESEMSTKNEKRANQSVCREDMELVLRSLGMLEVKQLPEKMDYEEIFNLFEEENPRLEEVKEAFNVFDKSRDGFIDAEELQSVLCSLGLKEGLEIENCRRMIGMVDVNRDGRIDFGEFVTFMENSSF